MRICRVVNRLPSASNPGNGSLGYHLTQHIPEPCLLIAQGADAVSAPLAPHVRLVTVPARDGRTPDALRQRIYGDGGGRGAAATLQAALVARQLRLHGRALAVALREMRRFRPDLVVCHQLQRLVYGLVARATFGCKLVVYLHGQAEIGALARLPWLRRLLRVPDRVAVVAPAMARALTEHLPAHRVWLSASGVDTTLFRDLGRPRAAQIVTVAHFKWMKGYDDLVAAAARVFARFPDHRLLVVGDGDERRRIEQTIRQLALDRHVVLAGVLGHEEIVQALNASRVFVMASTHEGLPRALLEAVACGTPAVVTDACNAEGIIETTGLCVPARDPAALAEAIARLLGDAALRARCGSSGPLVAARYDWRGIAARDHQMYRALVTPAAGRLAVVSQGGTR
ncbi:MAG TPA: glycosyltransferase family 4 protein [Candidatus Tectomicrobia bacterium]|nr:glycosyltransferase family 4 protein [Candidatus Tectomicrobia bacterium]